MGIKLIIFGNLLHLAIHYQRRAEEEAVDDLMLGFEGRYAVFLYVMPMQTDVKVAQLVDEQQVHVSTGLFPIGLSHAHDVAGLGLGEIIAIDRYDAVVIPGDGCGLVGAGGADLLSRYRGSQLRGRGNLDIGDEHIAVIHALLFQFHDDGIVPVAIFGIIGRNGRVARRKEVNGQRVHRGCGQNIAEYGAGQHGVWLGQRGFLPAFLLCIGGVQIALLRLLRDRAGGDQKSQGNRHQHRKHACGGNKGFAHRHRSFLNHFIGSIKTLAARRAKHAERHLIIQQPFPVHKPRFAASRR